MQPENLNFGDLIHRRAPFVVPPYQRAYAWGDEEIDDFIKDINALYNKRKSGNQDQHFFGGLVSVDSFMPGTYTGRQYAVIDGQQRLATFSMFLALIVNELEKIAKQAKEMTIRIRRRPTPKT